MYPTPLHGLNRQFFPPELHVAPFRHSVQVVSQRFEGPGIDERLLLIYVSLVCTTRPIQI
jgi:hypothetical protein